MGKINIKPHLARRKQLSYIHRFNNKGTLRGKGGEENNTHSSNQKVNNQKNSPACPAAVAKTKWKQQ